MQLPELDDERFPVTVRFPVFPTVMQLPDVDVVRLPVCLTNEAVSKTPRPDDCVNTAPKVVMVTLPDRVNSVAVPGMNPAPAEQSMVRAVEQTNPPPAVIPVAAVLRNDRAVTF